MKKTPKDSTHFDILRVFQSKDQTKAFYNKISQVYDLMSERSETPMRTAGLALLNTHPSESALEISTGTGHSLVALAEKVGASSAHAISKVLALSKV